LKINTLEKFMMTLSTNCQSWRTNSKKKRKSM